MTQVRVGWRAYVNPFTPEDPGTPNTIDQDVTNFILASGISDSVQTSAIETLVSDLKSYGLWTKMKAIYPFVGGTAASHKFNLKDPRNLDAAFRLVFNGGGVHSSTGYQLNGSNSWADTKLIPSNILSSNGKVSLGFYSRTNRTGANRVAMGSFTNPTSGFMIYPRYTDNKAYFALADDSNGNLPSVTSTLGFYQGARNNSTTQSLSNINGNNYSYNYNTTSLPNTSVYIGTVNYNPTSYVENLELAFSYVGEDLSAGDMSNYYTAVQKFQTTLGRHVGTPYVSDADAVAFLTAAGITDGTQASAINTLVIRMKADGVWTKMKAIYPFVGGTSTSHKFNLKDPRDLDAAFRLGFYGGWTHTSTGALPNGTTGYADTKFSEFAQITINDTQLSNYTHLSLYSRTNAASLTTYGSIGVDNAYAGWGSLCLTIKRADGLSYGYSRKNIYTPPVTMSDSRGFFMINRQSNTTLKYTKDNSLIAQDTTGWSIYEQPVATRNNVWLGAMSSDYGTHWYDNKEHAFASIGYGLTDTEATNLYNAVQEFQTTLGRQVNIPVVSDTDAQTFLNAANITSFQQASAVNKLVVDLKAAGVWTKMKAIYPFVGGSAASHKFNLKDPRDLDAAYRLVFNGGWTHTGTGAQPNGTTGYANTFFTPSSNFISNENAHISVYQSQPMALSDMGGSFNSTSRTLFGANTTFIDCRLNSNETPVYVLSYNSDGKGLFMTTKNGSAQVRAYRNNTLVGTVTTQNSSNPLNMFISARNGNGTPNEYESTIQKFISFGDGLTDTDATALYNSIQTYQTSLGRSVNTPVYNNGLVLNLDAGNANSYPGTGTTWFDLASGNNGTLVNGPTYDATNGGSLLFDGINDNVDLGTGLNSTSLTISLWLNFNSTSNQGILNKGNFNNNQASYTISYYNNKIRLDTYASDAVYGTLVSNFIPVLNTWYNIVYVSNSNSSTYSIYINGINRTTDLLDWVSTYVVPRTGSYLVKLGSNSDGSLPFRGKISKVLIYENILSATEILNNFNSTRGRFGL